MEILFVSSGNTKNGISPIIYNQGTSLKKLGHKVSFFTIKGKGLKGYLGHIFILRKFLKTKPFDVVHAHYSLSAMTASLAGARPLVVSLMGSDVKASPWLSRLIKIFQTIFWRRVIVKSADMKASSKIMEANILPNGVDFEKFKPIPRARALEVTGWDPGKKHLLFAANPKRPEKNFPLASASFELLNDPTIELHTLVDVPNELMPYFFNASDVVLLTSLWEGSPNVIKEAMACNSKIVAVDVGDIKEVMADTPGCYISNFDTTTFSSKIREALTHSDKTTGRANIAHLSANVIASKLTTIYKTILNQ